MPPYVQDGVEGREEKETKVKGGQGRWAEDTLQEGWATPNSSERTSCTNRESRASNRNVLLESEKKKKKKTLIQMKKQCQKSTQLDNLGESL